MYILRPLNLSNQGLNEDTGMAVAVKVLPRGQLGSGGGGGGGNAAHAAQVQELENEIALMQTLDHPNIVRYLGCEASPTCLYIFQEWVPCGSIADLLKAYGPLSSAVLQKYLKHVLLGLAYLHEQRVVHRDVKGKCTVFGHASMHCVNRRF
jgi:serine/threonine protein kinase